MPYIPKDDREDAPTSLRSVGELNYSLAVLVRAYLRINHLNYGAVNSVVEAFEETIGFLDGTVPAPMVEEDADLRLGCTKDLFYAFVQQLRGWRRIHGTLDGAKGAVRCCQLEFYARLALPYETGKRTTNGDVWT